MTGKKLPIWRSMLFVPVNVDKLADSAHTRGAVAGAQARPG